MNRVLLLFSLLALVPVPAATLAQGGLARYKGKNRVLLIFAPSKADPRWQKQDALLAHSAASFQERDLVRVDVFGGAGGRSLRTRYGVEPEQFRVLLIGKDGHVASSGPTPLALSALEAQIDRMPMRREEAKQQKSKAG